MAAARASMARRAGYADRTIDRICQVMTAVNSSSPAASSMTVEASTTAVNGSL